MNAVSIKEAMGSAATAIADGNAIPNISRERASNLNTSLQHIRKMSHRLILVFIKLHEYLGIRSFI